MKGHNSTKVEVWKAVPLNILKIQFNDDASTVCNGVKRRMWHLHPTAAPLSPIYNDVHWHQWHQWHSQWCRIKYNVQCVHLNLHFNVHSVECETWSEMNCTENIPLYLCTCEAGQLSAMVDQHLVPIGQHWNQPSLWNRTGISHLPTNCTNFGRYNYIQTVTPPTKCTAGINNAEVERTRWTIH